MHTVYAVWLHTPQVDIFDILVKYRVFKIANCCSDTKLEIWVYRQNWCVHNTSRALIFLYPRGGHNWKWQTDLICHFLTRELSFLCFPVGNKRSNLRILARHVLSPFHFISMAQTTLASCFFIYFLLFFLSFLTFRGKIKWLQVVMKIKAIHHYLLGMKKIHNNVI